MKKDGWHPHMTNNSVGSFSRKHFALGMDTGACMYRNGTKGLQYTRFRSQLVLLNTSLIAVYSGYLCFTCGMLNNHLQIACFYFISRMTRSKENMWLIMETIVVHGKCMNKISLCKFTLCCLLFVQIYPAVLFTPGEWEAAWKLHTVFKVSLSLISAIKIFSTNSKFCPTFCNFTSTFAPL